MPFRVWEDDFVRPNVGQIVVVVLWQVGLLVYSRIVESGAKCTWRRTSSLIVDEEEKKGRTYG
jgi:hypothetical protein